MISDIPKPNITITGPYQSATTKRYWYELTKGNEVFIFPMSKMTTWNSVKIGRIIPVQQEGGGLSNSQKKLLNDLFERAKKNANLKTWQVLSLIGVAFASLLAYRRGQDPHA